MDTIQLINKRRSVREFTEQKIEKDKIDIIIKAGLAGPSACNKRPWHLIVIDNRELLNKIADGNGQSAQLLKKTQFGIMVCADLDLALDRAPLYYTIDSSIACQNMMLAAASLNIGSVMLGTWPQDFKINAQKEIFNLPENIIPHSIVAFGYPKGELFKEEIKLEESKIHYNRW